MRQRDMLFPERCNPNHFPRPYGDARLSPGRARAVSPFLSLYGASDAHRTTPQLPRAAVPIVLLVGESPCSR